MSDHLFVLQAGVGCSAESVSNLGRHERVKGGSRFRFLSLSLPLSPSPSSPSSFPFASLPPEIVPSPQDEQTGVTGTPARWQNSKTEGR